jgi:hypothetical protein
MNDDFCFYHPRNPKLESIKTTLDRRQIGIIVSAIQDAWSEIETFEYWKSDRFVPQHYLNEDELSTKLMEILNHRLSNCKTGKFRKERFLPVIRDGKQSTATKDSHDQMPDLTFRLIKKAPGEDVDESALFVEAKLIDSASGCSQYVMNGLYRFVAGKYAPRMTFGLMLGYATPDFSDVREFLPKYYKGATSMEANRCNASVTESNINSSCFATDHRRDSPCPFEFRALHFWLIRPAATRDTT